MPIYTRIGDKGDTITLSGKKVRKDDPQVEAYGSVDELNALLGVVVSFTTHDDVAEMLRKIQKELFLVGAELALGKAPQKKITYSHVSTLESEIDKVEEQLPHLANFIIPGGSKTAAMLHLARTVCRRAERSVVSLERKTSINPDIIRYLNRLGDLLFVLARYENKKKHVEEVVWRGK